MKPIIQLDQNLINKIAAGEVVERPLSVVKELTENAIDAGATVITVEIAEGGLSMVRVTDNGGGIAADELPLAFSRHATSKIASLDDLFQVATLGFRGEALSSIAAVAQVEMITKTPNAVTGTRVEIHGGKILSRQSIGCANGTTIVVSNLFYNTPARRKFLKKPATEAGYISDCLQRLALGNPRLTLRYINNGKIVFQSTGSGELKTVMLNIYGREVAMKVIALDTRFEQMHLHGLVGKPETARGNRGYGTFIINGRYIQSSLLNKAIESAMRTMLPVGKFPLFTLNLNLPFDALDVNVHPTKMDVRFADENGVFKFIEDSVRDTLAGQNLIPSRRGDHEASRSVRPRSPAVSPDMPEPEQLQLHEVPLKKTSSAITKTGSHAGNVGEERAGSAASNNTPANNIDKVLESFFTNSKAVSAKERTAPEPRADVKSDKSDGVRVAAAPGQAAAEAGSVPARDLHPQPPSRTNLFKSYQIHGLIFNTYWLVTQDESLYLIDQHAAHERVLYENLLAKARENKVPSQQLLIPLSLRLTPREKQILADNKAIFQNFGFGITEDDDNFAIESVPMLIKGTLQSGFFSDLLDKIDQVGFSKDSLYDHKTELIAVASCKAAVKGGDGVTEPEARAMITQLMELENPFTCPHGRPTIVELTRQELERRFKRA